MKRLCVALALAVPVSFGVMPSAQTNEETSATVPVLDAFHDVIMPMWHTAYPARDYAALRKIAGDVEAGVAKIVAVKLPGILHDKEAAWARRSAELRAAGAAYAKAAAGTDNAALLVAAENLHTAYEAQVQVIRPVIPQMGEFHQTLYVVQHTYVPAKRWADVCKLSGELRAKAEAIAEATLQQRAAAKMDAYKEASAALVADARALSGACQTNNPGAVEKATEALHARYESLGKIFE
jgi:hypothetical protein